MWEEDGASTVYSTGMLPQISQMTQMTQMGRSRREVLAMGGVGSFFANDADGTAVGISRACVCDLPVAATGFSASRAPTVSLSLFSAVKCPQASAGSYMGFLEC